MQACGSLQKTTFGQEREHKHITGQKQKARDARVQIEQKKRKEKRPLSLCVMQCFAAYQEDCELLLTSSPLVGRQRLEKGGKTSCTQRHHLVTSHTAATHLFNWKPPSAKHTGAESWNLQLLCGMWTHRGGKKKELECNGSVDLVTFPKFFVFLNYYYSASPQERRQKFNRNQIISRL